PAATLARVADPQSPDPQNPRPLPGRIRTGSCLAWNDCWFFGTYGTVLRWDGKVRTDASPDIRNRRLPTGVNGAGRRADGDGKDAFGVAVGSTSERVLANAPLPSPPGGGPPAQLYSTNGTAWTPTAYTPPTAPQPGDPFRTDLVAVDFDPSGRGWAAGN